MVKVPQGATLHLKRIKALTSPKAVKLLGRAVEVSADEITVHAQLSIKRYGISGKNHVVSKPGQPPNADTRELDTGIITRKTGPLSAQSASTAPHAAPMEYGSRRTRVKTTTQDTEYAFSATKTEFGSSTTAARPYMAPAAQAKRGKASENVRKVIDHLVKDVT
jgi:hypothetical protein